MKARIEREIRRTNASTRVADAITTAIEAYKSEPFFFTEQHNIDVTMVSGQEFYTEDDSVWIGRIQRIDYIHLLLGTQAYSLKLMTDNWLDIASTSGSNGGQPFKVGYFAQALRFFPVPNTSSMSFRMAGKFEMPAPASDSEADNPWMTYGEELIRCRAKYEFFTHDAIDLEKSAFFDPERRGSPTDRAFRQIKRRTTAKVSTGIIAPWSV